MNIDTNILLISLAAFGAVVTAVAAAMSMSGNLDNSKTEDRLQVLTGKKKADSEETRSIMKDVPGATGSGLQALTSIITSRLTGWSLFFEQADSPLTPDVFVLVSAGAAAVGAAGAYLANAPFALVPVGALVAGFLPLGWLSWRRSSRMAKFGKQLPDALEFLSRALRSGNSLATGLGLLVTEMPAPISTEFQMAYEEQNLGVPLDQALKNMLKRMPNLDLKFFVTAVAIQRQTGGDLAEILDKIGYVIRERFKLLGTVQALTGEGRLSGAVLMAMPIALFFAVLYLNPEYVMVLFTTPIGKQMIGVGIIMQIFGAIVIKKIIDIKV